MFKDHIVDVDTTTTKHKVLEQISANRLYSFWSLEVSTFNFAKEDWQRSGGGTSPSCGIHFLTTAEDSFQRLKLVVKEKSYIQLSRDGEQKYYYVRTVKVVFHASKI